MFDGTGCTCNTGYILQASGCVSCSIVIPNCLTCDSATITCSDCSPPYYLSGGSPVCAACPLECTSCTSSTFCTYCIAGYDLVPDVPATPTQQSCQCISTACTITCPAAFPTIPCSSCDLTNCLSCQPGYYWTPYTCTACPSTCTSCSASDCFTCIPTLTLINGNCVCNDALQQYYDANNNICTSCGLIETQCTSCQNVLLGNTLQPTICLACNTGYYPLASSISCLQCPHTCISCTDPSTCTSCQPTYLMFSGTCACDTASQYF